MAHLVRAARVMPVLSPCIDDGALFIDGARIVAVDSYARLRQAHPGVDVCDYGRAVLLPPLVNAHTHLELTHVPRWRGDSSPTETPHDFVDWILQLIAVKRRVTAEQCRQSLQAGIEQCLRLGTGYVGDILSMHSLASCYQQAPLQGRLFYETLGVDTESTTAALAALVEQASAGPLGAMQVGLSPHAPYTLSPAYLRQVMQAARQHRWPLAIHLAESPDEVRFTVEGQGAFVDRLYPAVGWQHVRPQATGKRPWGYLQHQQPTVAGDLLVHGVQLQPAEINAIASAGAHVVLCPRSNARLQVGTADALALSKAGVPLALGTDSLASNDSLSLWDEMEAALATYSGIPAQTILRWATVQGAHALSLPTQTATLVEGASADYQVLKPQALPQINDLATFLCCGQRANEIVQMVMRGEPVLQSAP